MTIKFQMRHKTAYLALLLNHFPVDSSNIVFSPTTLNLSKQVVASTQELPSRRAEQHASLSQRFRSQLAGLFLVPLNNFRRLLPCELHDFVVRVVCICKPCDAWRPVWGVGVHFWSFRFAGDPRHQAPEPGVPSPLSDEPYLVSRSPL